MRRKDRKLRLINVFSPYAPKSRAVYLVLRDVTYACNGETITNVPQLVKITGDPPFNSDRVHEESERGRMRKRERERGRERERDECDVSWRKSIGASCTHELILRAAFLVFATVLSLATSA